ncbi:hypothetical protein F4782DRAFT_44561 [Xylaria castorea]|nr:hypothetical protein F4782DRAFT_44561 [Xylaria castorea]
MTPLSIGPLPVRRTEGSTLDRLWRGLPLDEHIEALIFGRVRTVNEADDNTNDRMPEDDPNEGKNNGSDNNDQNDDEDDSSDEEEDDDSDSSDNEDNEDNDSDDDNNQNDSSENKDESSNDKGDNGATNSTMRWNIFPNSRRQYTFSIFPGILRRLRGQIRKTSAASGQSPTYPDPMSPRRLELLIRAFHERFHYCVAYLFSEIDLGLEGFFGTEAGDIVIVRTYSFRDLSQLSHLHSFAKHHSNYRRFYRLFT